MPISNNRKTNVSRTIKNESEVKDEVKKIAKERIAEQLGLNKDLNKRVDDEKMLPEEKRYLTKKARDVEQAKVAIRNIKELEGSQIERDHVQRTEEEARRKAEEQINKKIEKQMRAQGMRMSKRERIVMEAVGRAGGKVLVETVVKIADKMAKTAKEGTSVETSTVMLIMLIVACINDGVDLFGVVGSIPLLGDIPDFLTGLLLTAFTFSLGGHGKFLWKFVFRILLTTVLELVPGEDPIPTWVICTLWNWYDLRAEAKKAEADLEKFNQDLKNGKISKEIFKKYG